ncbi:ComEC/Rec2 family competence protein, partial [Streptococcus danieliae]|nr:ComEC/Rec2 family competence protein [Streptococcus danieliae]
NFYSFDYKDYQNKHYVYKQVIIKDIKETSSKVNGIFNNINLLRSKAIQNINNNLLLDKAGYVQALIYGDKSNLEENDKEIYANIGISHLLAISGLHVAALLSIIYFILGKFNIEKNIKDRIILIILPIYAILAGFSPSVIRAVAMIAVYIIFKKLILASLDALFLVFLLMLFLNPYYVYDIGFQFSFFISFSLLMSGEYIKKSLSKLEQASKVSLIAGISSLPITVYYFNNFSFISILSN